MIRYINGRPMVWRGHRVERSGGPGDYHYRTLCGEEAALAYLTCDESFTCMECALVLDREKIERGDL